MLLHPDFEALMLFRDDSAVEMVSASILVSARLDDGTGASCIKSGTEIRCIDFAGYTARHVGELLRKAERPTVPTPTWAKTMLALAETQELQEVEVLAGDAGPLLMIHELDAVRFAFRIDRSWRLSSAKSGGKIGRPFYFGSLDTSRAIGTPSLGIILGSYSKESCVRSEVVELFVMAIDDAELTDIGSVVIGRGEWLALDHSFGPFDPKDPNHYRIQLRPRVQHDGKVRFEIESRHTPKALRNRKQACGVELAPREIDAVTKLIGSHKLTELLTTSSSEE